MFNVAFPFTKTYPLKGLWTGTDSRKCAEDRWESPSPVLPESNIRPADRRSISVSPFGYRKLTARVGYLTGGFVWIRLNQMAIVLVF